MDDSASQSPLPELPRDEAWWERELIRKEKLVDRYLQVQGDHPRWEKWERFLDPMSDPDSEWPDQDRELWANIEAPRSPANDDQAYDEIAAAALDFSWRAFHLNDLPVDTDIFFLSAGKVGANLAGGHSLGYDDETLCGNIVKCRWALADAEFCREVLEGHFRRTTRPDVGELLGLCVGLTQAIRGRIDQLRSRVWWY